VLYASDDRSPTDARGTGAAWPPAYECAVAPCSSRLEALRASLDYSAPLPVMAVDASTGPLPPVGSFLGHEPEGIVLTPCSADGHLRPPVETLGAGTAASLGSGGERLRLRPVTWICGGGRAGQPRHPAPVGLQTVRIEGLGKCDRSCRL